jgi:hypothetical protein
MKFSEYVIQGRQGMMMDPLGFLSPYSALQDKLFKQFTVLSNLPAYHGLLALIYQCLADTGTTPKKKNFSFEFRQAEIFWGVLHAVESGTASVLNITKYNELMRDRDSLALSDIKATDRTYLRLSYGTLGHYSSPSTTWGILTKSGQQLTERGSELATTFGQRNGKSLRQALDSWSKGDRWDVARLRALATSFQVGAFPERSEAAVWRKLIDEYCERTPQVRSLWINPMTNEEHGIWQRGPEHYAAGFVEWRKRYSPLTVELTQIERFEQLVGLIQHIFEREYLSCAEKGNGPLPFSVLEESLAAALRDTSAAYVLVPGYSDTKGLFSSLIDIRDYRDAAQRICAHHVAHQKSKGSVPFMEEGELRIRDKFDVRSYGERRSALEAAGSPIARLKVIAYQHRRDWHFQRAGRYHQYAKAA